MNRSSIEFTQYTANPVKGPCPHFGTERCGTYCYAEPIRRKQGHGKRTFRPAVLDKIRAARKPSTIFMGSMIDLMAEEIPHSWVKACVQTARDCPQHTFLFITKNPPRYGQYDWPPNCWLGFTDIGDGRLRPWDRRPGNRYFAIFEPLVGPSNWSVVGAEAVIIGVGSFRHMKKALDEHMKYPGTEVVAGRRENGDIKEWLMRPPREYITDLIEEAAGQRKPIFLKDNLLRAYPDLPGALRIVPWRV